MSLLKSFHYQILGDAQRPKLVFLHGLMGSGANWRKIAASFRQDFHILTYDQRGHGRSIKPSSGYSPEDYANDLKSILDELGWQSIVLVGHSMGGRNAMSFAARFPERLEKLVIEDISPESSQAAVDQILYILDQVPTPFSSKAAARVFFNQGEFERRVAHYPQPRVLSQYLYSNIDEKEDGSASWRFSREGIIQSVKAPCNRDLWGEWRQLQVPILLLRGSESKDFSRELFQLMVSSNSNVQGEEIPDSGHWIHFDQPELFVKALRSFF